MLFWSKANTHLTSPLAMAMHVLLQFAVGYESRKISFALHALKMHDKSSSITGSDCSAGAQYLYMRISNSAILHPKQCVHDDIDETYLQVAISLFFLLGVLNPTVKSRITFIAKIPNESARLRYLVEDDELPSENVTFSKCFPMYAVLISIC